jgi:hypothetical protein
MIKRSALLAVLLLQSACTPFFLDDSCGPTTRQTNARGELRDGGVLQAIASASVSEERGGPSSVDAHVMGMRDTFGAPLRGHVLSVRLVNSATGATLQAFPMVPAPPFGDEVIGVTSVAVSDPEAAKRVLRDGNGVLVLDTDLPGRATITVPLTEVRAADWSRAHCS